ncbi:hypothetical protein ES707_00186 [subsurface metagenome]
MTEWREAFCPLCGRTMGKRTIYNIPGKPYFGIERQDNLWEKTREFTGAKPFGVVKSSEGKGSMQFERYYGLEEDEEGYFPLMKARLLNIISEWLDKEWLSMEELKSIIGK